MYPHHYVLAPSLKHIFFGITGFKGEGCFSPLGMILGLFVKVLGPFNPIGFDFATLQIWQLSASCNLLTCTLLNLKLFHFILGSGLFSFCSSFLLSGLSQRYRFDLQPPQRPVGKLITELSYSLWAYFFINNSRLLLIPFLDVLIGIFQGDGYNCRTNETNGDGSWSK